MSVTLKPFQPFFLSAALFASAVMLIWTMFLHVGVVPPGVLPAPYWHGHELLFGFSGALIAGFTLTAVANWTGRATTRPVALVLLLTIWLAARIAFLYPGDISYAIPAILDILFFPALALYVGSPIVKAGDRRNYFLIIILLALGIVDLIFHLSVAGELKISPLRSMEWTIDLLVVLMLVMGGRVIPFFTGKWRPNISIKQWHWLDRVVDCGGILILLVDILQPASILLGVLLALLSTAVFIRLILWQPQYCIGEPMLWVLYLGYLWLGIGLGLRAIALCSNHFEIITALHAITAGALGSLALGMMTRVTLGHTGKVLKTDKAMLSAFILVNIAAILRTFMPELLTLSASLWALAFGIYVVRFAFV